MKHPCFAKHKHVSSKILLMGVPSYLKRLFFIMMKRYKLLPLFLALLFVSCEEVIDIELKSADKIIVIDATVKNQSEAMVKLNYTSDYFSNTPAQSIENAVVTLSDNLGNSEMLTYHQEGIYKSNQTVWQPNRNYIIHIQIDDKEYTAQSTLLEPVQILNVLYEESQMFDPDGTNENQTLTIQFTDNPNVENYYLFETYVNGELLNDSYLLLKDSYYTTPSNVIEYKPMMLRFASGDTVISKVYSIDKDTYTYYSQLNDLKGTDMNASSTPYNPKSNFGENVLGFFKAYSDVSLVSIVP